MSTRYKILYVAINLKKIT